VKIPRAHVGRRPGSSAALAPASAQLNSTNYTPMLHTPVPEKIWFYPIDRAKNEASAFRRSTRSSSHASAAPVPRLPRRGAGSSRAARSPASTAAKWTRRSERGQHRYFPVTQKGRCSISATRHAAMGDGELRGGARRSPGPARFEVRCTRPACR
jgi:hypothetical protein